MRSTLIAQLEREILPLQGIRPIAGMPVNSGFEPLNAAFSNNVFPLGAIHEFMCGGAEQTAASLGFMSALLSTFAAGGALAWVGASRNVFPPALRDFGISPDHLVFIHPRKQKDLLWSLEEVLKCKCIIGVIAEVPDFSFMASRRLQLAVEQSRVTGFILRREQKSMATASVARWRVTAIESLPEEGLPGVGFPRWKVELLRARNGKPGVWHLGWVEGKFELTKTGASDGLKTVALGKVG